MKERRLFLALPIPESLKEELKKICHQTGLPLKWIPSENLHVTILFLGSVNEERFNQVKDGVNKVVKNFPVFELEAQKVRVQKNRFQNMLWLDFKPSLSFAELVSEISKQLNFSSGKKPLPHVNLVRTKEKIMAVNLPYEFKPTIKLHVDSIELWESHLSPKGTTYSSLGSFPLKK